MKVRTKNFLDVVYKKIWFRTVILKCLTLTTFKGSVSCLIAVIVSCLLLYQFGHEHTPASPSAPPPYQRLKSFYVFFYVCKTYIYINYAVFRSIGYPIQIFRQCTAVIVVSVLSALFSLHPVLR
jgi:hypothetical protein